LIMVAPVPYPRRDPGLARTNVRGSSFRGKAVRVWADTDVIHLLVDGARVK